MCSRADYGLLLLLILCTRTVGAQESATQRYVVHVAPQASVSAPPAVDITHDGQESAQVFPPQTWSASGSVPAGVLVSLRAEPFTNLDDPSVLRDARLDIGVTASTGPAAWTVKFPTAATEHAGGQFEAEVSIASDGPGRADFTLGVSFLTDDLTTLSAGDYAMTVTATVVPRE